MTDRLSRPVVITRPAAQAAPLAARLVAAGREAVMFPLLEILPLPDQTALRTKLARLSDYALVAFVSPNAIDAAMRLVPAWPPRVAIGVMGEGSRQALAAHGIHADSTTIFSPRDPARTDSQTLLEALDLDALKGKQVLIVRGENGRELLADALREQGVEVHQVAAYRRAAPALDTYRQEQLRRLMDAQCDWIITSSEALRILLDQVRAVSGDGGVAKMQQQALIVPHARIAETAQLLGFLNITRTGSGDEQLLAALQSRA